MKKHLSILFAFLLCCSMAGAQTLTVPQISATGHSFFVASCTANINYPNNVYEIGSFTAETVDILGEFSVVTSKWTAAKAYPKYCFIYKYSVDADVSAVPFEVVLYRNGAQITGSNFSGVLNSAYYTTLGGAFIFYNLAAGDTIAVYTRVGDSSHASYAPNCTFQGYELP